jgi:hypothetical protein
MSLLYCPSGCWGGKGFFQVDYKPLFSQFIFSKTLTNINNGGDFCHHFLLLGKSNKIKAQSIQEYLVQKLKYVEINLLPG